MLFDVISLITDFIGSKKAAKGAKKEAAEQAYLEGLVTDEKLRTLRIDERTLYGQTMAGFAGGGVLANASTLEGTNMNRLLGTTGSARPQTGSVQSVMSEQSKSFKGQRDITATVGATKAQQALTRGQNLATQYKWQGYSNLASGISDILGKAAMMGAGG